nr:5006_t:CDS:2 [Entrophospora candida]
MVPHTDLAKLFETLNFDAIRRYANGEKIASQAGNLSTDCSFNDGS